MNKSQEVAMKIIESMDNDQRKALLLHLNSYRWSDDISDDIRDFEKQLKENK